MCPTGLLTMPRNQLAPNSQTASMGPPPSCLLEKFTVEYFNIFFLFPCILWSTIFQLCGSLCLLLLGLKSFYLIFKAKSPHQTGWETRLLVDKHFWLYSFPLYSFVLWCGQTWLIVFCSVVQFCGQTWLIVLSITRHKAFVNRTENKGTITVQRYMLEQQ